MGDNVLLLQQKLPKREVGGDKQDSVGVGDNCNVHGEESEMKTGNGHWVGGVGREKESTNQKLKKKLELPKLLLHTY